MTLTNAGGVCELIEDGDTTYVYDPTNGHENLYDLANFAVTPTLTIAVQSRMFANKSDSGTRNGQIRVKSSATEVGGSDTALPTSVLGLTASMPSIRTPRGVSLRTKLAAAGIDDRVMYKASRNKPLKPWQTWFNKVVAAIRCADERRFALMKRHYGFRRARYIGL